MAGTKCTPSLCQPAGSIQPDPKAPGVHYFSPGVHEIGKRDAGIIKWGINLITADRFQPLNNRSAFLRMGKLYAGMSFGVHILFPSNWGRSVTGEVETYGIQLVDDWVESLEWLLVKKKPIRESFEFIFYLT